MLRWYGCDSGKVNRGWIFDGDGKMVRGLKWCQTRMKICGIKLDLCVRAC